MKKERIVSKILKIIAGAILLYGLWVVYDWRLWRASIHTNLGTSLKIFLPILVLGSSGTLYGVATLLDKNK